MTKQKSRGKWVFRGSKSKKFLRKNVPQINKLERLFGPKNLKLMKVNSKGKIAIIFYEGIASQELYPGVGEELIKSKVIREDNLMGSRIVNKGKDNEYEKVRMSLDYGDCGAWVFLKACNPNYKINSKSKILKTNLVID